MTAINLKSLYERLLKEQAQTLERALIAEETVTILERDLAELRKNDDPMKKELNDLLEREVKG